MREALVTLRDRDGAVERTLLTPRSGDFAFPFLPPNEYELTVESVGFVPYLVSGMDVRAGSEIRVSVPLERLGAGEAPPVRSAGTAAAVAPPFALATPVPGFALRHLPTPGTSIAEVLTLGSAGAATGAVDGLPAWMSTVTIDGARFRPAADRSAPGAHLRDGFARSAIAAADLVTNGVDVEWSGGAAPFLSVHTLSGSERLSGQGSARWSGSALPGGSGLELDDGSFTDLQGDLLLRAPAGDGGRIAVGLEARRLETPFAATWPDSPAAADLIQFGTSRGIDLAPYGLETLRPQTAVAGFTRLDAAVSDHQLFASAHFMHAPSEDVSAPGFAPSPERQDLVASASAVSPLAPSVHNVLQFALTRSSRSHGLGDHLPLTVIAGAELAFGREDPGYLSEETHIRVGDAVHYRTGQHLFKAGAGIETSSFGYGSTAQTLGSYWFGSVDDLAAETGSFARIEGPPARTDWRTTTVSAYVQDTWRAADALSVTVGVRADRETLPSEVRRDAEWLQLTGIANDSVGSPSWRIAPRLGVFWSPGRDGWHVHTAAGIYHGSYDPLVLGEWQLDAGTNRVRRAVGALAWPDIGSQGVVAPRLTILDYGYEAPRTARATAGVSRTIDGGVIYLTGVFRRTENLPRRTDLNLLPLSAFSDQHGRPVYGRLAKTGALVVAEPGSSRRFTEYDEVAALTSDGWSDHFGVSVGAEYEVRQDIGILARYTYSRTTDNWFGATHGGWSRSAPAGMGDWAEGVSDFERPHTAIAGVSLQLIDAVRLGAVYRMASAPPFTPGFRPGVDLNADGIEGNDPAYVDPALAGVDEVVRRWPCLRQSVDRFAERNSCRGDPVHGLDLSIALRFVSFGRGSASLLAEVFNVLESVPERYDSALYLIDPAAELNVDEQARTVDLPLLVNPDFGRALTGTDAGRRLRVGLSITW